MIGDRTATAERIDALAVALGQQSVQLHPEDGLRILGDEQVGVLKQSCEGGRVGVGAYVFMPGYRPELDGWPDGRPPSACYSRVVTMKDGDTLDVRSSYDRVADEYTVRIAGELTHKPLDRRLLEAFAERVRSVGPVCDLGCGPGHVTRYLRDRGVDAAGIDLSSAMVGAARRRNPGIEFTHSDMRSLSLADGSLAGVVAFYSLIHFPRTEISAVMAEIRRVLRPGGLVLVAFHIGDTIRHLDEWWGRPVSLDFVFFSTEEMSGFLTEAGFRVVEAVEREPYPDVEHPSRRAYLLAEKANR